MTNTTNAGASLDKVLKRVQFLLAKAESTQDEFPEEADACRKKAEALMAAYRLEESMLAAAAPVGGQGFTPEWAEWDLCTLRNEFQDEYMSLAVAIMRHVGAEGVYTSKLNQEDGQFHRFLRVVGYASDLRYGEMLLTAARLAFGEHLEPSYNPNETDAENAYRMRKSGMEGWRIAYVLWGEQGAKFANSPKGAGRLAGKARRLYKAEAERRGEQASAMGQGTNMKTWRNSYAEGFVSEIRSRLWRMRYEAGEQSQAVILAGRKDAVLEAFWEEYPQFKPTAGKAIGNGCDGCERCAKAKSGYCRDHQHLKPSYSTKEQSFNNQAYVTGGVAARTVDLGTTGRITS